MCKLYFTCFLTLLVLQDHELINEQIELNEMEVAERAEQNRCSCFQEYSDPLLLARRISVIFSCAKVHAV